MPRFRPTSDRPVRWARLAEIDYRCKVGTPAWVARHPRWQTRKLSAWRRLHAVAGDVKPHDKVRKKARSEGVAPSSDWPLRRMVTLCKQADKTGRL